MYIWDVLHLCNIELGYFQPFEVCGGGVKTAVGCGGKTASFSLVLDTDLSPENLKEDYKIMSVTQVVGGLSQPQDTVLASSARLS